MKKIIPTPHTVCRTPAFSIQTTLEEAWPGLKRLIADASPDFYQKIAKLDVEDIMHQPEKIRFTIWKYFNRSKYRATPFGRFAAVSLVPVSPLPPTNVVIPTEMKAYHWTDWTYTNNRTDQEDRYDTLYRTNPTSYIHEDEYRYLYKEDGQFILNAIPRWDEISAIMEFCKVAQPFDAIVRHLHAVLGTTEQQCSQLFQQLMELQAMQSNFQPNITGTDYFERVNLPCRTNPSAVYTIAKRPLSQGHLAKDQLHQIAEYLSFASQCLPMRQHRELDEFKNAFIERWENQAIPLSLALDPVLGIPYGNDMYPAETSLQEELRKHQQPREAQSIRYAEFEQFLLNNMLTGKEIRLEGFSRTSTSPPKALPNTLNVQLHFYKGKPVIHTAGGVSATSLLGRFTQLPEFHAYGKMLTDLEQRANPEVAFFDLAYECEGKVDNVNRRQHLYPLELTFSSWSTMDNPLRIEDIMVSIVQGQIVLHHYQTGKRLVPRLASAYNYGRSDLAHFRFLCDLQQQQIQTTSHVDIQRIWPKLERYPRVYYKDCIVCPAKWLLPPMPSLTELKDWLVEQGISKPFSIGNGDQTLLINPSLEEDLHFLYLYQKKEKHNYIAEALLSEKSMVQDQYERQYHAEFIVDFFHTDMLYPRYRLKRENLLSRDLLLPGDEWVYLELYVNPIMADDFLRNEIKSLIANRHKNLKQWFFIRYNDPEDHLRLRLKPQDPKYLSDLIQHINQTLSGPRRSGHLKKVLIKEYDREIHRYGADQMELVEHFFYEDSKAALSDIGKPIASRYGISMGVIQMLCERLYPNLQDQINYFSTLSKSFAEEMKFDKNDFKLINKEYRNHHIAKTLRNGKRLHIFDKIMAESTPDKRRQLLADLIHMHINRRFSSEQRLHEAIIYQYLHKISLSKKAIQSLPKRSTSIPIEYSFSTFSNRNSPANE